MPSDATPNRGSTVDAAAITHFSGLAPEWWDQRGAMAVLHKFNPVRLGFIKDVACRQFARDGRRLDSLAGLRILDIGCGGGNDGEDRPEPASVRHAALPFRHSDARVRASAFTAVTM